MEHEVNFGKSKMSKKNKVLVWLGVLLLLLIFIFVGVKLYIDNYNKHIDTAEYYFKIQDYKSAYEEIDNLFPKSYNKDFVEKIQIMYYASSELDKLPSIEYSINGEKNYNLILGTILHGLNNIKRDKKRATELGIEKRISTVHKQYIEKLKNTFDINEKEARDMDHYSDHDREIWLSIIAKDAQKKNNKNSENTSSTNKTTLEIVDKHGEVDGDFIKISGAVKNNSQLLSFTYIKVQVDYLDGDGNIIDSDWTYVNSGDALKPNAQKYFDLMSQKHGDSAKYKISVIDFSN